MLSPNEDVRCTSY